MANEKKGKTAGRSYSPTQLEKLFGINYNTILYWTRIELVRASVRYEARQWTAVLYAINDAQEILLVSKLREMGRGTAEIKRVLRLLRENRNSRDVIIDISGRHPEKVSREEALSRMFKGPFLKSFIDIDALKVEVENKLARLERRNAPTLAAEAHTVPVHA